MFAMIKKKNGTVDLVAVDGRCVAKASNETDARMLRPTDDYAGALVSIAQIQANEGETPDFEALYFAQRAMALQALLRPGL